MNTSGRSTRGLKIVILIIIGIAIIQMTLSLFQDGTASGFLITLFLIFLFFFVKTRWQTKEENFDGFENEKARDARWCTNEEFEETNNPNGKFDNGIWIGGRFTRSKFFHALVIGGSGSGKTSGHIIPNLLLKPVGSYVFNDIKGEIAFTTARAQKEYGQKVFILDFWGMQESLGARHGIKPSGFNPFDFIKHDSENLLDNCQAIAYFLCPDKPGDKDTYWVERGRTMIKTVLLHIITGMPEKEHNFWTLYKVLRMSPDDWASFLLEMKKNPAMDGLVAVAAEEWLGMLDAESTMMSIRSNAQAATSVFESPALRHYMQRSDFDPFDLTNGDCTVYVVIPERFLDSHSSVLRLIIGLCLKACNAKPNNAVYYFLDEAPLLKKMEPIQRNFAFGRGQNIHLLLYAQSISALKEIYGDAWEGFVSNSAILQLYGGARDQVTQKYFSSLLGMTTVVKRNRSFGSSTSKDGSSSSTNTSYSTVKEPLLTPEEISNIDGIITIADGKKMIISNIPYFKNRYDDVTVNSPGLDDEERKMIKKGVKPVDHTYEHFKNKADQPIRF